MKRTLLLLALPLVLLAGAAPAAAAVAGPPPPPEPAAAVPYTVVPASPRGQAAVQQVTAVLVAPMGKRRDYTPDQVRSALEHASTFYQRETNGRFSIHVVSISDWVQPDDPHFDCANYRATTGFAQRYSGWTPGPNKHLMVFVPDEFQCGGVSVGDQNAGPNDGGESVISSLHSDIVAHEMGHNLSLHHASSVQCADAWDFDAANGLPTSCSRAEYGDNVDVMGSSYALGAFSAPSLARLGLISNKSVPTCGGPRRIPIQTMSAGFDARRIISWTDPQRPAVTYYVQFRDAVDESQYDDVYVSRFKVRRESGVQILRTDPTSSAGGSILVRPGDRSASKELVHAGESIPLVDGMRVSVVGIDERTHVATVDVTVPCGAPATGSGPATSASPEGRLSTSHRVVVDPVPGR